MCGPYFFGREWLATEDDVLFIQSCPLVPRQPMPWDFLMHRSLRIPLGGKTYFPWWEKASKLPRTLTPVVSSQGATDRTLPLKEHFLVSEIMYLHVLSSTLPGLLTSTPEIYIMFSLELSSNMPSRGIYSNPCHPLGQSSP